MAITQINSYAPSDNDPTNLMTTTDDMRIGLHEVTITEYKTSTVPAIAIGSVIEVNGTLFKAGAEQAISGSPSNGTVYIYMVPSGSSPSQILTPTFTNTAPTWFDSKQGWYDATGTYRYIHYAMTKATASYSPKWEFPLKNNKDIKFESDGGCTFGGTIKANDYDLNNVLGENISGTKIYLRSYTVTNDSIVIPGTDLTGFICTVGFTPSSSNPANVETLVSTYWSSAGSEVRIRFKDETGADVSAYGTLYYLSSS